MKIAIIGAGFTGMSAAWQLVKQGHEVHVYEKNDQPGGLALGFKEPGWEWSLEDHYHHLFTSDNFIINLAKEVGHNVTFYSPKTSTWLEKTITQLDSPLSLLSFKPLSVASRLRTGLGMALLRFNPIWRPFEFFTAKQFVITVMGQESWQKLWEPLFVGKFGEFSDKVSAAWFWSRIYKRSASLGYPDEGFLSLAQSIEAAIKKTGGIFHYNAEISEIKKTKNSLSVIANGKKNTFDKVICTLPAKLLFAIAPELPENYIQTYASLGGLGAVNLIISFKKQFFNDKTYWLNINEKSMPFLAVVEHTNFIDSKHYGNEHLVYIGNYLSPSHRYFSMSSDELVKEFMPHLKKINSNIGMKDIYRSWVKKAFFAQPLVGLRYSKNIPPIKTPINNLYLANMQQVYPWDRGTNYAVELGIKVANLCTEKSEQ